FFFFSSRRRHTRFSRDWSSDVCSSDLKSIVRDALVTSVTCSLPPVSFQISQESTVPKARSPASARARAPWTLSRIHLILVPEKRSEERRVGKECRSGWEPELTRRDKRE